MVQYSNRAKACHQSEKDVSMFKQSQNLSPVRKRCKILRAKICQQSKQDGAILKQNKPVTSQKMMVQYSNREKTCHQSEKDGTILKQGQNLSPVRKKMVQY